MRNPSPQHSPSKQKWVELIKMITTTNSKLERQKIPLQKRSTYWLPILLKYPSHGQLPEESIEGTLQPYSNIKYLVQSPIKPPQPSLLICSRQDYYKIFPYQKICRLLLILSLLTSFRTFGWVIVVSYTFWRKRQSVKYQLTAPKITCIFLEFMGIPDKYQESWCWHAA